MKGSAWYYVTRLAIVALWVVVATVGRLPLWAGVSPAVAIIAYFVWLPRSSRYVLHEDQPLAPMRRNERTQAISGRAAAWAFAVETLLMGMGMVWAALSGREELAAILGLVLGVGMLTYPVAPSWPARRSPSTGSPVPSPRP